MIFKISVSDSFLMCLSVNIVVCTFGSTPETRDWPIVRLRPTRSKVTKGRNPHTYILVQAGFKPAIATVNCCRMVHSLNLCGHYDFGFYLV